VANTAVGVGIPPKTHFLVVPGSISRYFWDDGLNLILIAGKSLEAVVATIGKPTLVPAPLMSEK
jgi:hypothetical protein